MGRSGGDGTPGDAPVPGGESKPVELWITHGPQADPRGDTGRPPGIGGPPGGDGPPGHGPARGTGGPGRGRWVALIAGFVALVAVIAVQHFAGGSPTTSPTTRATSTGPSPRPLTSTETVASSAATSLPDAPGVSSTPAAPSGRSPASITRDTTGRPPTGTTSRDTAAPDTTSPRTSSVPKQPALGDWQLVGYARVGLIRYRPSTGAVTITPVPPLQSSFGLSFVATRSTAIIRSMDNVLGYLVPDGKPAAPLDGLLESDTRVLPGPDPDHLWVVANQQSHTALVLVDIHGTPTGPRITLPDSLGVAGGYGVDPDGAGYALITGVGGVYDARPGGLHLVTHGQVVAVGPTGFLVYDCDDAARCFIAMVDGKTFARKALPGLAPPPSTPVIVGALSPDGSQAAEVRQQSGGATVQLVNLRTGHTWSAGVDVGTENMGSPVLAYSPDGRYLLVSGASGVVPLDNHTQRALAPLPLPAMTAIAVLPGQ